MGAARGGLELALGFRPAPGQPSSQRPRHWPLPLASNYFSVVRSRLLYRTQRRHHSQAWNLSRLVHRASPRSPTLAGICPTGIPTEQATICSGRLYVSLKGVKETEKQSSPLFYRIIPCMGLLQLRILASVLGGLGCLDIQDTGARGNSFRVFLLEFRDRGLNIAVP